jgi:hypothetical protein
MSVFRLTLVAVVGLAAGLQSTAAAPFGASANIVAPMPRIITAANPNCPKGQRWIPAGYAKHGKYRAGHCATK